MRGLFESREREDQLAVALRQAKTITSGIKYDDTVNGIISEIQTLANQLKIDPRSVKYAINDVLEAKNNLESAVYGLDELFKDAWQEEKWKNDDEEEGLAEERPKSEIEVNPNDNFTILDIKKLEQINDLDTLKKQAKHLIKGKPIRRMKPEKIAYFYDRVDTLTTRMKVIKLMYDLLLAGEGLKTIGSWNSTDPNAYAKRFNEEENKPKTAKALIYQTEMYGAKGYYGQCKEPGCDHKTKTYDRVQQAQNAIKKHHQEHFKVTETHSTGTTIGSAGIGGGSGLGIEKSPIEKVLEKPFESLSEDAMADQFYDEFSKSSFKPDSPLYLDNLKGVKDFLTSKNLPQDKLKFLLRKLVQKIKPEMESSIMQGIQTEYKEVPTQRKIVFDKENPPDLYYLYQQFIQRMLNPENTIEPNDWIDKVNKHYGLNYTWKDYQKRGHNDQTNNWQKIVDKYILKK